MFTVFMLNMVIIELPVLHSYYQLGLITVMMIISISQAAWLQTSGQLLHLMQPLQGGSFLCISPATVFLMSGEYLDCFKYHLRLINTYFQNYVVLRCCENMF